MENFHLQIYLMRNEYIVFGSGNLKTVNFLYVQARYFTTKLGSYLFTP